MAEQARRALGQRVWLRARRRRGARRLSPPAAWTGRGSSPRTSPRAGRASRRPPRVLREPIFHPEMAPTPLAGAADRHGRRPGGALELDPGQLAWLADVRGLERGRSAKLRNYTYVRVPRAHGPPRVIERPKLRLKEIQRWILHELLVWIPPHDAAHGFVRGRSARTPRRPAHRPPGRARAGPRGLLRVRRRGARLRHLPHRGLSGGRRAHADRAVHERRARRGVRPGRVPAVAPARDAAPAAGRADLAGAGQPRRLPARRAAHRPRGRDRRPLLALRRRPDVLRRPLPAPAARRDRDHRPRRGLPRERGQDARDGPRLAPARHRHRRQRPPEHRRAPSTTA